MSRGTWGWSIDGGHYQWGYENRGYAVAAARKNLDGQHGTIRVCAFELPSLWSLAEGALLWVDVNNFADDLHAAVPECKAPESTGPVDWDRVDNDELKQLLINAMAGYFAAHPEVIVGRNAIGSPEVARVD